MSMSIALAGRLFALARPLLLRLDPERAHALTIAALKAGLAPRAREPDPPALAVAALGLSFSNPLGLAAGFDKNAEVADAMLAAGFGFVEAGTVTPRPQAGNPRPRLFRLPQAGAVINRLGFNNDGHAAARARLAARRKRDGIVGINIGANRDAADPVSDYCAGLSAFAGLADYVTVNVSSPNTPGLRDLQQRERLDALLAALTGTRAGLPDEAGRHIPILLKIAPDLDDSQIADICRLARGRGIDGLIVSNTTVSRPGLAGPLAAEQGGLSGRPLFELSTRVLAKAYLASEGALTLIGAGGVASGADAYAKIRAGASLVQLYTALIYEGPGLVGRIKTGLARALARDGFDHVGEAVGRDAQGWAEGEHGGTSTGGRR